ncbi:MAG: DUF4840 domain-containing protein [Prevotella sp.]|nr:DUF4840 domain-containing protein [Prevotella sp.]
MKKTRYFMMLMLLMAVVGISMTSCLSDADNNNKNVLSPAEKSAMITEMAGEYSGHIYFINDSARVDSILTYAGVTTDSLFTIHNFPYEALIPGVQQESMREVLSHAGQAIFQEAIRFYISNVDQKGLYTFWALPLTEDQLAKKINYDGTEHEIKVKFSGTVLNANLYTQVYYPCGEFYKNEIIVYVLLDSIVVDKETWSVNRVLFFHGKK